jgi:hypothetical protein
MFRSRSGIEGLQYASICFALSGRLRRVSSD